MLTQNSTESPTTDDRSSAHPSGSFRTRSIVTWGIAVLVPLAIACAVSFFHNDPHGAAAVRPAAGMAWPTTVQSSSRVDAMPPATTAVAPVGELVSGLEQRLAQDPRDAKGWALLAQSHAFLGHSDEAEAAIARAITLGLDEAELRRRVGLAATARASRADNAEPDTASPVVRDIVSVGAGAPVDLILRAH